MNAPQNRGAELSTTVSRDTWRVVADDGRTYTATVLEPATRSDYHHARMTVGSRTAEKCATTARRAVCLAAMDLGLGVVEIRAPVEWVERKLASILLFWPRDRGGKRPRALPVKVAADRWELEVTSEGAAGTVPPPIRAAGRTRVECLRNAVSAGAEAIRAWGVAQRRIAELATDRAEEAERWCAEHTREIEGA